MRSCYSTFAVPFSKLKSATKSFGPSLLVVIGLLLACEAKAQYITPANETGFHAYGTYDGSSESVSLSTGNLTMTLPLLKFPGRAGLDFSLAVQSDSKWWSPAFTTLGQPQGQQLMYWQKDVRAPMITPDLRLAVPTLSATASLCGSGQQTQTWNWLFTEPNGSKHHFLSVVACGAAPGIADSDDTALLRINPSNLNDVVVYLKDGAIVHFYWQGNSNPVVFDKIVDRNGNTITSIKSSGQLTGIVDTLGRTYGVDLTNHKLTYNDANGVSQSITFTKLTDTSGGPITLAHPTAHTSDCPSNVNYQAGNTGSGTTFSGTNYTWSISIPNGASGLNYTLQFDVMGELIKIVYPSGGYTRYDYGAYSSEYFQPPGNGIVCTNVDFREVVAKHECKRSDANCGPSPAPTPEDTTTYSATTSIQANATLDVLSPDPSGVPNKTHYTFSIPDGYANEHASVELTRSIYLGSSTLLRTVQTDYTEGTRNGQSVIFDGSLPIRVTTTHYDITPNISRKQETDYDSLVLYAAFDGITSCGSGNACPINNPIELREFDFNSALIRRTDYTWNYSGDYAINNKHILDLKATEKTYDSTSATCQGASHPCSETDLEYDNYTEGIALSGATQLQTETSTRGNLTATNRWLSTTNSFLTTRMQYDDAGNVIKRTDPLLNPTKYSFTDSWRNTTCKPTTNQAAAYVGTITDALGHATTFVHDSCSGLVAQQTDPNLQTTTYNYDTLGRTVSISYPDKGSKNLTYQDAPPRSATLTTAITTSLSNTATTYLDGLSRLSYTLLSDPDCSAGVHRVDTSYDSLGRVYSTSNPYCTTSDPTYGLTTYLYEPLGRTCVVIPPDGTAVPNNACPATQPSNDVFTVYSGNMVTVTDEAGKSRKSATDALGRLTDVWENPSGLNYHTVYSYDALDNLTGVVQNGSRNRAFVYDSLSRLTSATNPESGSVAYTYDANGNLTSKTAPAPNQTGTATVTTCFGTWNGSSCDGPGYDALNRPIHKNYSDANSAAPTSPVGFQYDEARSWGPISNPIGRLTTVYAGTGGAATGIEYSYDPMGRTVLYAQCDPSNCGSGDYETRYTYDLAGNMLSATVAGFSTISYQYDSASRPTKVTSSWVDPQHPGTLATMDPTVGYWPNGALRKVKLGNGLYDTAAYNKRLQPCRMNTNSTSTFTLTQCTDLAPSGNVLDFTYGYNGGANNGNIASWSATGQQAFNRTYFYDSLNRIATMADSNSGQPCKGLSWNIDAWGNLTNQNVTQGSCPTFQSSANTKNQLTGAGSVNYQYDAAGNMTYDGSHTYYYDAENRLIQVDGTLGNCSSTPCYVYDANGLRVRTTMPNGGSEWIRDLQGNVVAQWIIGLRAWGRQYVYLGSQQLAEYGDGITYFIHHDHLGSTRLTTRQDGSIKDSYDYLPFGQITSGPPGGNSILHLFTGKEHDAETATGIGAQDGFDYFGARYYASRIFRFMSPDPLSRAGLPLDTHDPQSWNAYAYVRNNPLNLTDPDGTNYLVCQYDRNKGNCADLSNEQYQQFLKDNPNIYSYGGNLYTYNPGTGTTTKTGTETYYNEKDVQAAQFLSGTVQNVISAAGIAELAIVGPYAAGLLAGVSPEIGFTGLGLGGGGLAIGKMGDLNAPDALNPGEYTLPGKGMPNQGSPQANWEQNASMLRFEMSKGKPIRDVSAGKPGSESGFLRAERNLLRDHGWTQQGDHWYPPKR